MLLAKRPVHSTQVAVGKRISAPCISQVVNPASAPSAPVSATQRDGTLASSTIQLLQQENELLRGTILDVRSTIAILEDAIKESGKPIPPLPSNASAFILNPVDFWSPALEVPHNHVLKDDYGRIRPVPGHDGTECFQFDEMLWEKAEHFKYRWQRLKEIRKQIDLDEGGIDKFTQGYQHYGFNRGEDKGKQGIWYREWAPGAKALCLIGEFNKWTPTAGHWAFKNTFGVWELFLPDGPDGKPAIPHRSKIKCRLETATGAWVERIPAWIKWATQEWNEVQFNGVHWDPPESAAPGEVHSDKRYVFKYPRPPRPRALRIYECHVGMSSAEPRVNSYLEFKRDVLPRVRMLGYNAIQIMAVQEHAYYASFGYHVTNFFAPSSRCGTPEELKAVIDEAHRLGLVVLMDIVHSHASKNTQDGINMFDGSDAGYFHGGPRGHHWVWDSRCFDYGNWETLRFLLSNARWWMDEYKFDGYRFDGVTSMMYNHHGMNYSFTGNYDEYFGLNTDTDAVVYLTMVNQVLHDLFTDAITIGEDVSGMPAFCRPWDEGGVGFDYRLNMAIADTYIASMTVPDQSWDLPGLVHAHQNRRASEMCVSYAESHDQALVGDKTLAFWMMDADMYGAMAVPGKGPSTPRVDRGLALHKMMRLLTMSLGGESYLNFMGNEFGHPEWIDFPREGNLNSYDKCRRRWDLADNPDLRYKYFQSFDRAMCHLDKAFGFMSSHHTYVSRVDNSDKLIVAERGDLLFVFNFHPDTSYTDYRVGCQYGGQWKVVLSSDEECFGGFHNTTKDVNAAFDAQQGEFFNRPFSLYVYAPSRTVVVYARAEYVDAEADRKPHGIPGLGVKGMGPNFAR